MGTRRRHATGIAALPGMLLLLFVPILQVHYAVAVAEDTFKPLTTGVNTLGKYGDSCTTELDCLFQGSACDNGKCLCKPGLPATNQIDKCGRGSTLNESCFFNEQCEFVNPLTECRDGICICRFEKEGIIHADGSTECVAVNTPFSSEQYVAPTMIAILVIMCLMFIILCVVLRLFSRERWRENRTIFNTPNPRLMNVSLLRDSKHGDRRGSKTSIRAPSRHASTGSLKPHSPSLQGSRRGSKTSSNASLNKNPPPAVTSSATTPVLESVTVEIRNAKA